MEFVLLGLLGLAVTWGVVEAVRDDDDSAPEPEGPDPDDVLIAESHSILNAGGGNDTIIADNGDNGVANTTIHGGGGNDTITLVGVANSLIEGGPGNDTIQGSADNSNVYGGMHNDEINVDGNQSYISGGLGDDTIIANGGYSTFHGDRGDDLIDARNMWASSAYGGRGDDLIILGPQPDSVPNSAYGGAGDDTLRAHTIHSREFGTNTLYGGAGADRFEIIFEENIDREDSPPGIDPPLVTIADFVSGSDLLNVQFPELPGGAVPEIQLTERADGSGTAVTIHYLARSEQADGSSTETTVETYVWLAGALGVTLDDIEITYGDTPAQQQAAGST